VFGDPLLCDDVVEPDYPAPVAPGEIPAVGADRRERALWLLVRHLVRQPARVTVPESQTTRTGLRQGAGTVGVGRRSAKILLAVSGAERDFARLPEELDRAETLRDGKARPYVPELVVRPAGAARTNAPSGSWIRFGRLPDVVRNRVPSELKPTRECSGRS
jgi:hypothetical protein